MRHLESKIQTMCVRYFRIKYPKLLIYAIGNGGKRNVIEASIMKGEGVTAGVADLQVLVPNNEYHALFIEMKTEKTKQSLHQIEFELYCNKMGYKYVICRSVDSFMKEVKEYLNTELTLC